ncbi:hypothetical protein MMC26_004626 [Xylographa opegraphella]|nr:hypothetical protein [Xylographa opegraphella]
MPTNRPFFSNFLAAFRAHSAIQKSNAATASVSTTTASLTSQTAHISSPTSPTSQTTAASAARAIATKTPAGLTSAAVQAAFSPTNTTHTHHARHPSTSGVSRNAATPLTTGAGFASRNRRGSDSSSEGGFRDALGGEKWFIGGRTAQGEERFYRLGMVTRERSNDRASLDRMSL